MNGSGDNEKLIDDLANLLNETAEAHHKAFAATEGVDPDWPVWYADYLLEKMQQILKAKFTKSELIYLLVSMDKKNGSVAPGAYWPRFYAKSLVNRYL
jgi:NAD(P)H-hydrate epimerase